VPQPKLPPAQFDTFRRLASAWSDERLGRHFGLGATTAARYRRKLGVERPPLPKNPAMLTVEEQRRLTTRWGKVPMQQLAKELGRCGHTVRKYAKLLGLPLPIRVEAPDVLERRRRYLTMASDQSIPLREISLQTGISITHGKRLRKEAKLSRSEGNRFMGSSFHPGTGVVGSSFHPGTGVRAVISTMRVQVEGRPKKITTRMRRVHQWRCWRCNRLNEGTTRCETTNCTTRLGH
jgi:hypothetical protein